METLTERQELEREAARIGVECFNSFYFFFKTFWPEMSGDAYIDSPHIKFICDKIQFFAMPVLRGEPSMQTIIINVPPGSSKSTIATIAFPMWIWLRAPHLASTNVSYSATLSERHAKKARNIIDSEKWKLLFDNIFLLRHGKRLEITTENIKGTENNFKGERFVASVDGNITGKHADFIIKDDMQDPLHAKSDTMREHANVWDEETLTSRHKNQRCYLDIIIAQRLHENDLCGYTLKKNLSIYHICLPSEITNTSTVLPEEAKAIYTDGILDPYRRPREVLDNLKSAGRTATYTTQYLQMPFNLEEQDIKPSMFEIIDSVKDDLVFDLWVDGAYTEKTENDPTGIDLIARDGNNIIWKDSWDVWKKLPDLLAFIKELAETGVFDKEKGRIFIEPKASGTSLADYIEFETDYNFVRIGEHHRQEAKLVQGGKKARHELIKPKAESHRIKVMKGNWNESAITQICGFPRASHDEHVDNLGYAINHYYFNENTFIEQVFLDRLSKLTIDSVNFQITSRQERFKFHVEYKENEKGDVQLFDYPTKLHKYRYLCVLVLRKEADRGGETVIMIVDRLNLSVPAMIVSDQLTATKAAKRAIELASMYDMAKLVVCVQNEYGTAAPEELDMGHMAIKEIRSIHYDDLYSRLSVNDIQMKREREYGFEINASTRREIYYNLKETIKKNSIENIPLKVLNEISLIERKKETGEIEAKEGQQINCALAYSVALKVSAEMYDKPKIKKVNKPVFELY